MLLECESVTWTLSRLYTYVKTIKTSFILFLAPMNIKRNAVRKKTPRGFLTERK